MATLEAFFQAVAQAIFAAQPLETVALGGVSFVEAFGRPLVKEDLIFSAVEDAQGRLWVGTLGGGLRRIEVRDGVPQDTLHLTRQEGLGSNLILALARGAGRGGVGRHGRRREPAAPARRRRSRSAISRGSNTCPGRCGTWRSMRRGPSGWPRMRACSGCSPGVAAGQGAPAAWRPGRG